MKRRRLIIGVAFMLIAIGILDAYRFQKYQPRARSEASSIVLSDGRVLRVGGMSELHPLIPLSGNDKIVDVSDCDLFDPKTETWSVTGGLCEPDRGLGLIRMKNGSVLAFGDRSVSQMYLDGKWREMKDMGTIERCAPLPSGELLFYGRNVWQVCQPETGTWRRLVLINYFLGGYPVLQPLKNGRILAIEEGGWLMHAPFQPKSFEGKLVILYDPEKADWTSAADLPESRNSFGYVLLQDGRVLVCGGVDLKGYLTSAVVYDPKSNKWSNVSPMPKGRVHFNAITLADGRVLVAGGSELDPKNATGSAVLSCYLYDPKTDLWSTTGSLHDTPSDSTMPLLPDGRVLSVGIDGLTELYDPKTGTWQAVP